MAATASRDKPPTVAQAYQHKMNSSSVGLLSITVMIACFLMEASAFQTGISSSRPHIARLSSSQLPNAPTPSSLYSTPMKDIQAAADTGSSVSVTDFIMSEISTNDVRTFQVIHVVSCSTALYSHALIPLFSFSSISAGGCLLGHILSSL